MTQLRQEVTILFEGVPCGTNVGYFRWQTKYDTLSISLLQFSLINASLLAWAR